MLSTILDFIVRFVPTFFLIIVLLLIGYGIFQLSLSFLKWIRRPRGRKNWAVVRYWEGHGSKLVPTCVSAHRTKRSATRRASHMTAGMSHVGFWYEVQPRTEDMPCEHE